MTKIPDRAGYAEEPQLSPLGIAAQIAAIEAGLAREAGPVIELSNAAAVNGQPYAPRKRKITRASYRGTPMLLAVASEDGIQLETQPCPFCRRPHYHGRHGACPPGTCGCRLHEQHSPGRRHRCTCPVGAGDGPRAAHCRGYSPDSPFLAGGYVVKEITLRRLIWPDGVPPASRLAGRPSPAWMAECSGMGLSRYRAGVLWASAVAALSAAGAR
jgi:hypothetical protein